MIACSGSCWVCLCKGSEAVFCWFHGSGGHIDPAAFILRVVLHLPDWLVRSEETQTTLSLKHKHMWCGFVSHKGMHSSLPNCLGDGCILHWYCIYVRCAKTTEEPMKWQSTSNRFYHASDSSRQNGCCPSGFLLWAILRKKLLLLHLHLWAAGRAGDEEWCGCRLCWQTASCLSHAHCPLRTAHDLLSLKPRCPFTVSQGEMSKVWQVRKDLIFPLADDQSANTYTNCSAHLLHVSILLSFGVLMRFSSLFNFQVLSHVG